MDNDKNYWKFPAEIEFWAVPDYLRMIEKHDCKETIIFDLSETDFMHSSFIGLLIVAKQRAAKNGGELVLKLSSSLVKILSMLKVKDYFTIATGLPEPRKTA